MATANNSTDTEFSAASALAGLATQRKEERQVMDQDDEEEFHIPQRFTKSGRKRAVPFTIKLMKVLSDKKNADIITWMPSGKSFNILKPKAFVADILPQHFKTAKYSSFTRKLHRWGFMRHYRGEEAGAFYHKDFQRGRLDLVEQMTCHKAEPPKSTPVITAAVTAEKKALVKPAPLRPATMVQQQQQQQQPLKPRVLGPPSSMLAPPATPETIKMSVLQVPTSAMASTTTPVVTRTPVITTTPSLSMASITSALPPMAPRLTPASAAAGGPSAAAMTSSDRLNAAIELEVNRRIKERINAVALQRQAFAVSALRQQQLAASFPTNSHHHRTTPAATTSAFESQRQQQQMAALLLQKQAGLFKNTATIPQMPTPMPYRALAPEGQSLPGAPPKNIHGARTA